MLTREEILGMDDRPTIAIRVPEWKNGTVFVRTLTAAQREQWERESDGEGHNRSKGLLRASLVAMAVCDSQGVALFKREDIPALADHSAPALIRVFDAVLAHNKVSAEDVDRLEKNSEASPSDSSASDSPAN